MRPARAAVAPAGGQEHASSIAHPSTTKLFRHDSDKGIRSFVVGTCGGENFHTAFTSRHKASLEAKLGGQNGVLELTLGPTSYQWRFITVAGRVFSKGEASCH